MLMTRRVEARRSRVSSAADESSFLGIVAAARRRHVRRETMVDATRLGWTTANDARLQPTRDDDHSSRRGRRVRRSVLEAAVALRELGRCPLRAAVTMPTRPPDGQPIDQRARQSFHQPSAADRRTMSPATRLDFRLLSPFDESRVCRDRACLRSFIFKQIYVLFDEAS